MRVEQWTIPLGVIPAAPRAPPTPLPHRWFGLTALGDPRWSPATDDPHTEAIWGRVAKKMLSWYMMAKETVRFSTTTQMIDAFLTEALSLPKTVSSTSTRPPCRYAPYQASPFRVAFPRPATCASSCPLLRQRRPHEGRTITHPYFDTERLSQPPRGIDLGTDWPSGIKLRVPSDRP